MKKFIIDMVERAIKTACQGAIVAMGTTASTLGEVSWITVISSAGYMFILSVLTSIASKSIGNSDSASMVDLDKVV